MNLAVVAASGGTIGGKPPFRGEGPSGTRTLFGREPETQEVSAELSAAISDSRRLVNAVTRVFSLTDIDLPDEFFPAHLTVALVDAVFRSGAALQEGQGVQCAERYCLHFGLSRVRGNRWEHPPRDAQETLRDLVVRYEERGMDAMMDAVFHTRLRSPGSDIARSEHVLRAATALRGIGIEVLQDVSSRPVAEVERTLRCSVGIADPAIRSLLMYTGADDFVRGDEHVRRLVGNAICRGGVSSAEAEALVRKAAYELILSPRYLDREIWNLEMSFLEWME